MKSPVAMRALLLPAWRTVLTDQEIWEAAAYVLSISRQKQ